MNVYPLPALILVLSSLAPQSGEHPVPLPADFDAAKCVECHADVVKAKNVHAAVTMGCTSCHQVASDKDKTSITLIAQGGALCTTCHEASKDAVLHGPYKDGRCTVCHNQHASDFPKLLRADAKNVCAACHLVNQPGVKIDDKAMSVTLLGDRTISLDEYRNAPKLGLDRTGRRGHPIIGHPLEGPDPRKKDAVMTCRSCHTPHSSALPALMPAEVKNDLELCTQCHK